MDLKEIGINTRNWVESAQDRDYWRALVNDTEPPGSIRHLVSSFGNMNFTNFYMCTYILIWNSTLFPLKEVAQFV